MYTTAISFAVVDSIGCVFIDYSSSIMLLVVVYSSIAGGGHDDCDVETTATATATATKALHRTPMDSKQN